MAKRWLRDILRYMHKVFLPEGWTKWAKDERKDPEIEPGTIWVTLLIGFILQVQSLEELERRAKENFQKLLPRKQRPPSADTIRHSSIGMELATVKNLFAAVINKARRSKMLPSIRYYRVAAIDGTGLFSTRSRCCPLCHEVHHQDGTVTYEHKVVTCQVVGGKPPLILGHEPILPGEGETTAAKRLIDWLYKVYKHFADVVVVDAGFAKAPFINYLLSKKIHVVVRLKDDRMHIVRDAEGVFSHQVPAKTWREDKTSTTHTDISAWDEEHFETWDGVEKPLRVVKFIEIKHGYAIVGGKRQEAIQKREILVATTMSKQEATPELIREIIHRRWEIENTGFHELKGNWNMEHCYIHQEVASQVILWFMLLAVNLFWLFLYRNRRSYADSGFSAREIAEKMRNALEYIRDRSLAQYLFDTS
ncbi:MAG TPA: transposase [Syntrophomonadaceae bacterium]|nr:transposase [Syntrophomonadaceae bacterium]